MFEFRLHLIMSLGEKTGQQVLRLAFLWKAWRRGS